MKSYIQPSYFDYFDSGVAKSGHITNKKNLDITSTT